MAIAKDLETIAFRVLVEFVHEQVPYVPNQIASLPSAAVAIFKDLGWIDDHPDAVAQAAAPAAAPGA